MTKELLASIEEKYSESTIELEYQSISMTQEYKERFIEGYTQAEQDSEEMIKSALRFAKENYHFCFTEDMMFELFKESLNK